MAVEHRESEVKRGLSFVFTMWTWLTIGPAVLIGLAMSAGYAQWRLKLSLDDVVPIIVFYESHILSFDL